MVHGAHDGRRDDGRAATLDVTLQCHQAPLITRLSDTARLFRTSREDTLAEPIQSYSKHLGCPNSASRGDEYEYYLCRGLQEGECDLPHLPVSLVEDAILREVQSLRLTPEEVGVVREQVVESLDRQLGSQREATARVKKELATIDVKEERLLDLVADGSMTTDRVRERLAKLYVQRHALTQKLATTEDDLRRESDVIQNYLDLLEKPAHFTLLSMTM